MCLLLIEASRPLRDSLGEDLRRAGYPTQTVGNCEEALASATRGAHRVILLDVELPGADWLGLLRRMRAQGSDARILLLTPGYSKDDCVKGLNAGADDCVPKPLALDELIARVRALLRDLHRSSPSSIQVGDLAIDTRARRVTNGGLAVQLTAREFQLLACLAQRRGEPVSQYELEDHLYGSAESPLSNSIASAICLLRKKLRAANNGLSLVHTKRGHGYYLSAESA